MSRSLPEETYRRIEALFREGVPKMTIARRLGISVQTVHRHIKRLGDAPEVLGREPLPGAASRLIINDINDPKEIERVLKWAMETGRPQEAISAIMANIRIKAETDQGNPAHEPMTAEEDAEFKRYLREDAFPHLCDACKEAAIARKTEYKVA